MKYVIHNTHGGFISKHWDKNSRDIPYTASVKGAMTFGDPSEAKWIAKRLLDDNIAQILDILILLD